MSKEYNSGVVNTNVAVDSIVESGGGVSSRYNSDGSVHTTAYSKSENRHLSYDEHNDGKVSNVHTDKDNRAYVNYKSRK